MKGRRTYSMRAMDKRLLKSILLLFGSLVFAQSASCVLHELGHAIAYWTTGGTIERIVIHPFSWSYVIPGSVTNYPNFTTWGGVVFGTIMALLLVAVVWRWRGPYVMPALLTGVVACIGNGYYLVCDYVAGTGHDAGSLVESGTPGAVVVIVGVALIGVGFCLAGIFIPLMGIRQGDGAVARVLVFAGALIPYAIATQAYWWAYNVQGSRLLTVAWVIMLIVVALLVALSSVVHRRIARLRNIEVKKVSWSAVGVGNLAGFVLLSTLLILVGFQGPKVTVSYRLFYFDGQSDYAGIRQKKTYNPTASPGGSYEFESFFYWNWRGLRGDSKLSHLVYDARICAKTREIVIVTKDGILAVAIDNESQRWVLKQDGMILSPCFTANHDGSKGLVWGVNYYNSPEKSILIALDVVNGRNTQFACEGLALEMTFIDDDSAVASVGEDLVRVEFTEAGEAAFAIERRAGEKSRVGTGAVYRGERVFRSATRATEDAARIYTVEWGGTKVEFVNFVLFVHATQSYVWAIDSKRQVFRLDSGGNKCLVGSFNKIIGHGTLDDKLWVASDRSTVTVFGDSKETFWIELP